MSCRPYRERLDEYEKKKHRLQRMNLSLEEYEAAIRKLVKELRI